MQIEDIISKQRLELNEMQQAVAHAIVNDTQDVVVLSPTGSGKTYAYLLPLQQLLDSRSDEVQAIVIVPGRELALQSATVLKNLGTGLRTYACYGGRPTMDEHRELRQVKPQIVFGTPGRLNDHIVKGNIQTRHVCCVVIDEFDKCLEMGFQEEMATLMVQLPRGVRHLLLSATASDQIAPFLQSVPAVPGSRRAVSTLDYRPHDEQASDRVSVYAVHSPVKDKLETLSALLRHVGGTSSIVFLNYRDSVMRTASYLAEHGFSVIAFHGGLEQKQREEAIYKFSNNSVSVLVSTDLGSRGLDIPDIENIIHYHIPEGQDGYIHRVGRTARWNKTGHAYFILSEGETIPDYVDAQVLDCVLPSDLPAPAQPRMATIYIGKGKKDKLSKGDIVGFLCKKGGLKSDEIGRIDVNEHYAYVAVRRERLGSLLRQVSGEKIKGLRTVIEEIR